MKMKGMKELFCVDGKPALRWKRVAGIAGGAGILAVLLLMAKKLRKGREEKEQRQLPFRSPVYFINRRMNTALQGYLAENHFDIIITTHIFPAEILTNMKRHGITVPKTIFVATDYVCIPFTEETECDAYVIPADDGIPTHGKFAADESREAVRRRLGLENGKRYILITGGSMGGGKIEKAIMGR